MQKSDQKIMKKFIFTIPCIISFNSISQTIKVVDKESNTSIPFAKIEIFELSFSDLCDQNGEFILKDIAQKLPILISYPGYLSKSFKYSNEDEKLLVQLEKAHIVLDEVVISPTTGIIQKNNLSNVYLKKISLNQMYSPNLIEILTSVPGVYSINTGSGISKPVIRGLSGLKVVTFLNGLRIDNQQWANDHGNNFSDIGIKNVEIVKGPSSLLYGADALGGVLFFVDEDYTSKGKPQGSFQSRFESNTLSFTNTAGIKLSSKKVKLNLYASTRNYADYQIPNGNYVTNSRFKGNNLKTSIGISNKNWVMNLRYNYINNEIGLPGHTHSANPSPDDFQGTVQNRERYVPYQLINDNYLSVENKFFFDKSNLQILSGFTSNMITEHDKVTIPEIKMLLTNVPYNIKYTSNFKENATLILGSQGMFTSHSNDKSALNELIPNANSNDLGMYSLLQFSKNNFETQIGFRYDHRSIETEEDILNKEFKKLNSSFGVVFSKKKHTIRGNFSSGFRPPHLSELLSDGVHHGTNRYEIGNTELDSEFANQFDLSYDYSNDHLKFNINPFINLFNNYIYVEPIDNIIDGYNVYIYSQAEKAKTYGGEFFLHYHPHFAHKFHIEQNLSLVMGEDENNNSLPLIPQTRLNTNLRYDFEIRDNWIQFKSFSIQWTQFLDQNNISTFESASEKYQIFNLETNFSMRKQRNLNFKIGISNIFNEEYINHLSNLKNIGIPNQGRNLYFVINYLTI